MHGQLPICEICEGTGLEAYQTSDGVDFDTITPPEALRTCTACGGCGEHVCYGCHGEPEISELETHQLWWCTECWIKEWDERRRLAEYPIRDFTPLAYDDLPF